MSERRPSLLLHCQHSLGLGHLVRSLALGEALAEHFRVTILCGGAVPRSLPLPDGVEIVSLPPIHAEGSGLSSSDPSVDLARAFALRRELILGVLEAHCPDAVVVELFPFGRKKLAHELVPFLEAARAQGAVTVSSVRDLLVSREDGASHDERAAELANRLLDAVLVHSDPWFARLEETFRPRTPLRVPVWHTGFVVRPRRGLRATPAKARVVVSAGGGRVGAPLLCAAVDAHRLLGGRMDMTVIAGPFLPEPQWTRLHRQADGVLLRRSVPDLGAELATASASVSQCGYNTALEVVSCGIPALVVPFAAPGEDEQTRRAERLARRGAVRVLPPEVLSPAALADELERLLDFRPAPHALDLGGGAGSAELLDALVRGRLRGAA